MRAASFRYQGLSSDLSRAYWLLSEGLRELWPRRSHAIECFFGALSIQGLLTLSLAPSALGLNYVFHNLILTIVTPHCLWIVWWAIYTIPDCIQFSPGLVTLAIWVHSYRSLIHTVHSMH